MKIVLVLNHESDVRHFEKVVRWLCQKGHIVNMVMQFGNISNTPCPTNLARLACQTDLETCIVTPIIKHRSYWQVTLLTRELINYAFFFKPGHPSKALRHRWKKYLPQYIWWFIGNPVMGRFLASPVVEGLLRLIERISPPDSVITDWLRKEQPDVVWASPFILQYSLELEYIKAAQFLGIPTVVSVLSWDNLSTKGTFQLIPDITLLWNHALFQEAVELHKLPPEKIRITGAPTFDYWFESQPSVNRVEFCQRVGVNPEHPFIVYLCSSRGMIQNEKRFIEELAERLGQNSETNHISILVRPHPFNMINWKECTVANIRIWPEKGAFTDNSEAKQNYYDTLFYSMATIGVNTSAMIEAAIADRPCVTIIDPRYKSAQTEMGHFQHLLNGDFMEVASSYEDAVTIVGAIVRGRDVKADNRRKFVRNFIRPCGTDRSASEVMAQAIEFVAQKRAQS